MRIKSLLISGILLFLPWLANSATVTASANATGSSVKVQIVTWTSLANGDFGSAWEYPHLSDRTVQITGTFGAGGTISLEGSNDGTNYEILTDPQGNSITKTASAVEAVTEITRYIRPHVTAGDGTTSLTVTLILKYVN